MLERTSRRIAEAPADRLARLTLSGRLQTDDPAQTAEQLFALLTTPLETRSRLGTREVSDAGQHEIADSDIPVRIRFPLIANTLAAHM
ncbi:TetR/AcrR family transcriptional regulator C-terminal domain-containing protein [Nocardia sp. R16R-3T]